MIGACVRAGDLVWPLAVISAGAVVAQTVTLVDVSAMKPIAGRMPVMCPRDICAILAGKP